ncbi:cysteine hydrolase family protein [Desulfosediminicola flagellatus]|uniref:cysteine hydrolase family protein n=1 Tax=Desulfosediminicola flagellatus TaxID=2569541 RepID=UPI0010AC9184|nr:cysteine hydrolase family protein [Desulfosediminicola flagellatus]
MGSAIVIIDVQCGLFDVVPRPFEADEVISRINELSERARKEGVPVIFIQHEQAQGILEHGSQGWELVPGLIAKQSDYIVRKSTPDSFQKTGLDELLQSLKVSDVIVCGYATEFCVDTTVRRSAALGYSVQLAADAHTTHDKEHATASVIRLHHNETLSHIRSFGPVIQAVKAKDIRITT